ncbi:MAG: FmdB family transcriptional regulator [Actinomycetota bacterium]|nr:FmdB family transcriptional regulator [Actinomycetota bacterium]
MPIYEYACTACGERTEAKQGFDDPPLQECPVCGGKLRKLYSPVGIVFKGSGFYSTDKKGQKRGGGETKDGEGSKSQDKSKASSSDKSSPTSSEKSSSKKSSEGKAASSKSGSDSGSRTSGGRR